MIPDTFAQATIDREGEQGAAWLAELPAIVEDLPARWGCTLDGEVTHGQVGVIVPVRDAVPKVSFPHPGNVHVPRGTSEIRSTTVRRYSGRGPWR